MCHLRVSTSALGSRMALAVSGEFLVESYHNDSVHLLDGGVRYLFLGDGLSSTVLRMVIWILPEGAGRLSLFFSLFTCSLAGKSGTFGNPQGGACGSGPVSAPLRLLP